MILKRYKILILLSLFLCACTDDYDENKESGGEILIPSLSAHWLYPSQTEFDAWLSDSEFTMDFNVESIGTHWEFTGVGDWFSLFPLSGSESSMVSLTTEPNLSAKESRTAIFYLSSTESDWDYDVAMSVSQPAGSAYLSMDSANLTFPGAGGTQIVTIMSNCEWEASTSYSWLQNSVVNYETGQITVVADANTSKYSRRGDIIISSGAGVKYIDVVQSTAEVAASETYLSFGNAASKYSVVITSDIPWSATTSQSWISVSPSTGENGSTTMEIEVTPNTNNYSRYGYVQIYTGSNYRLQISVNQKGNYITPESNSLLFSSNVESKKLKIESNTDWSITEKPNWISLSETSGSGSKLITVTSTENPSVNSRKGTLTIEKVGTNLKTTISVTQKGKFFTLEKNVLQFSDKAGTQNFSIKSDASWTSIMSETWFSATPLQGKGNADVSVMVEENKNTTERIGTIAYNYCDLVENVNVYQQAKYATIDNDAFTFDSNGGTSSIVLLTNDKWTAEIDNAVKWLSLSSYSGIGESTLTLNVEDNASINKRSTTITITPENAQAVKIYITQNPRYLRVNSTGVLFFATGGTSDLITVETDGTYEIKGSDTWFTINNIKENVFTVTTTENTLDSARAGSIIISLTGLSEGSLSLTLPVIQACAGGSFILNGYDEEVNWGDAIYDGDFSITIGGFTSDVNWNENQSKQFSISVTGYTTEHDWNRNVSTNGKVTINPYGNDKSWSENIPSNGAINSNRYKDDSNWDSNPSNEGTVNKNGYNNDKNWNPNTSSDGTVNKNGYSNDMNWNANSIGSGAINKNGYGNDKDWNN